MRLYHAICALIEAHAAHVHTHTLEAEMDRADWVEVQGYED